MHILSGRNYSEFLAVPQLVRFDMAHGASGLEPTLLVKTSSLTLKYLLKLKSFRIVVFPVDDKYVGYAVQVNDDPRSPATLWSIAESPNEIQALLALVDRPACVVFLFNELAVNIAWGNTNVASPNSSLAQFLAGASVCSDSSTYRVQAGDALDKINKGILKPPNAFVFNISEISEWHEIYSTYITNSITPSKLSMLSANEGDQQEELALWLVDDLLLSGAVKNPRIHEVGGIRELSDLLLSYEFGCFLLESKGLSILERGTLPERAKLTRNVIRKLKKAISQLIGACKNLKRGLKVTDQNGREIVVERTRAVHAIVVVPDLSLLADASEFGRKALERFGSETDSFLHILDPSELLRMVQSARKISSLGKTTTPIMAFDYYLTERFKKALECDSADFGMLLRIVGEKDDGTDLTQSQ